MRVAEGFELFVLHRGLARGIQTQLHNPALSLQSTVVRHQQFATFTQLVGWKKKKSEIKSDVEICWFYAIFE
jgi:hypothetical protein